MVCAGVWTAQRGKSATGAVVRAVLEMRDSLLAKLFISQKIFLLFL